MASWIALFRGINVGGKNVLPMKDLVALLESLGCEDVKTYIQSGNAVLSVDDVDGPALEERIADAIRYHHEPPAEDPGHDRLFDIVHAADIICLWAGLAIGSDGLQYKLAPHVRKDLGLDRKEAEAEITTTWGRLRELEEMMGPSPAREARA